MIHDIRRNQSLISRIDWQQGRNLRNFTTVPESAFISEVGQIFFSVPVLSATAGPSAPVAECSVWLLTGKEEWPVAR